MYRDMAYRVLADHVRTLSFAIADGAQPSNEGRGYVLRRILRRAVRYGMQTLGAKSGFFSQLVPSVAVHFGDAYPELRTKAAYIQSIISEEEQSFASLLERGIKYFSEQIIDMQAREEKVVSGEMAFYLYDTLGFPVDLTQIMADEKGFKVDTTGFQAAMTAQKERGRQAGREKRLAGRADITLGPEQIAALQKTMAIPPTDDSSKYEWDVKKQTRVRAIISDKGAIINSVTTSSDLKTVGVILEDSSFYAESGGQISDTGSLTVTNADGSMLQLEVVDVQVSLCAHIFAPYIIHFKSFRYLFNSRAMRVTRCTLVSQQENLTRW